jgi:aldehyde dehydrogenase (NAD+)
LKGFIEMKREFEDALLIDLGRCSNASWIEYQMIKMAAEHDLYHLKTYMADVSEETELLFAPAKTYTRYEPMGVCAIYSAWNYPIMGALKPLVQCITTGNAAIIKPSEIAPETSKAVKRFIERYLDQDFYRCIEGAVDVAVKLNQQPLDLICFTGSTQVGKIVAQTAAKNLTRCILELGGKCPAVVH